MKQLLEIYIGDTVQFLRPCKDVQSIRDPDEICKVIKLNKEFSYAKINPQDRSIVLQSKDGRITGHGNGLLEIDRGFIKILPKETEELKFIYITNRFSHLE